MRWSTKKLDQRLQAGEDPDEISATSWERIETWLSNRGLILRFHQEVPVAADRWIGVVPPPDDTRSFAGHCLVMCHDELVFDPACSIPPPPDLELVWWGPEDVNLGITIEKGKSNEP